MLKYVRCAVAVSMLLLAHSGDVPNSAVNDTLTIGYLVPWTHGWSIGGSVASVITIAIQEVYDRQLLPGYSINFIVKDSWCEPNHGFSMAVESWVEADDLDFILGAACSVVCQPVSLLTAAWNLPTISYSCTSEALSDKEVYPTFTRSVGTWNALAPMFTAVYDLFGWSRVGIITTTEFLMLSTAQTVKAEFERIGKTVVYRTIDTTVAGTEVDFEALGRARAVIRDMKEQAFNFLFFAYGLDTRNLLICAYDEGMMNGGYTYMSLESAYMVNEVSTFRPELDEIIWQGFMNAEPRTPSGADWDQFRQQVIDEFQDPMWNNWTTLPADAALDEVQVYAGLIYEALLMWAYGVNATLEDGGAVDDGRNITKNIFNLTFPGLAGLIYEALLMWAYGVNATLEDGGAVDDGRNITKNIFNLTFPGLAGDVTIDEKGDRKTDQAIAMIQDGAIVNVMHWLAASETIDILHPDYSTSGWQGIIWSGGMTEVPSGSPVCGWDGELCSAEENDKTGIIVGASVGLLTLTIAGLVGYIGYHNHKQKEAVKEAKEYCISWNDIQRFVDAGGTKQHTTIRTTDSGPSVAIGTFRDQPVARNLCPRMRETLTDMEFWTAVSCLRSLLHENILWLSAVVVAPEDDKCVLSDTAMKGSLYDFIDDGSVVISHDFKLSILADIASGMKFLQQSVLGFHGKLSSKCCVLDNKWVCKISDYWERHLAPVQADGRYTINEATADGLLWTATEVLRGNDDVTAKCDVFSYGIIVQEVLMEDTPYAGNTPSLSSKDTVNQVRNASAYIYRPTIPDTCCSDKWRELAEMSWKESVNDRPSWSAIMSHLKQLNGGKTISLTDSMASRLEAHTRHLEDIVLERSSELDDEKARAETLVCELLPRSVYEQLKAGKQVEPETFEQVTLFFSDIVSFTRISSLATPIQIVRLLNGMYSIFDEVMNHYDVYKVATIGDAYVVASGLPNRNGDKHAVEIAAMSLRFLECIADYPIPHIPGENIQMRIGLHTGSCVAGVTGLKTPRYLLFGDTVNTAGRIEALGAPMRVHVSETTSQMLLTNTRFALEPNDKFEIPGYGPMYTFWLNKMEF